MKGYDFNKNRKHYKAYFLTLDDLVARYNNAPIKVKSKKEENNGPIITMDDVDLIYNTYKEFITDNLTIELGYVKNVDTNVFNDLSVKIVDKIVQYFDNNVIDAKLFDVDSFEITSGNIKLIFDEESEGDNNKYFAMIYTHPKEGDVTIFISEIFDEFDTFIFPESSFLDNDENEMYIMLKELTNNWKNIKNLLAEKLYKDYETKLAQAMTNVEKMKKFDEFKKFEA